MLDFVCPLSDEWFNCPLIHLSSEPSQQHKEHSQVFEICRFPSGRPVGESSNRFFFVVGFFVLWPRRETSDDHPRYRWNPPFFHNAPSSWPKTWPQRWELRKLRNETPKFHEFHETSQLGPSGSSGTQTPTSQRHFCLQRVESSKPCCWWFLLRFGVAFASIMIYIDISWYRWFDDIWPRLVSDPFGWFPNASHGWFIKPRQFLLCSSHLWDASGNQHNQLLHGGATKVLCQTHQVNAVDWTFRRHRQGLKCGKMLDLNLLGEENHQKQIAYTQLPRVK